MLQLQVGYEEGGAGRGTLVRGLRGAGRGGGALCGLEGGGGGEGDRKGEEDVGGTLENLDKLHLVTILLSNRPLLV